MRENRNDVDSIVEMGCPWCRLYNIGETSIKSTMSLVVVYRSTIVGTTLGTFVTG